MARSPGEMDPRPTRPVGAATPPAERAPAPERAPDPDGNSRRPPARSRGRARQPVQAAPKPSRADRKADRKAQRPAKPVKRERRLRHTIQKVDLWSVMKLSLCFYLCGLAVCLVALVSLWLIADAFGIVSNVEEFVGDLLSSEDFTFLSGEMLRGVTLVGLVVVMLQVVVTVMAAAFYNLFAELFGGIEVTVVEEEPVARS
ncbi:MAG: DUF3566 domain-containing protein [Actinomycetota bacterium]